MIAKSRPFARPEKKNSGRIWEGFSFFEHLSLKVYRRVFSFWELRENCEIRKPGRTFFAAKSRDQESGSQAARFIGVKQRKQDARPQEYTKTAREAKKKRRKKRVSEEEKKMFFSSFNGPLIMVYSEMNYDALFDFPPSWLPLLQLFRALLPGLSDFDFCSIFRISHSLLVVFSSFSRFFASVF